MAADDYDLDITIRIRVRGADHTSLVEDLGSYWNDDLPETFGFRAADDGYEGPFIVRTPTIIKVKRT